jgi:predicted acyl esterase
MVEIVASQDWVLNNAVGLVGLSYSGITQLYTAATNPPHLAAITPQSVIVDPWLQQWPGGVYNAGFTRRWLEERDRQAAPNGQDWAAKRVQDGDKVCESHQTLRNMNLDFESFGKSLEMRPEAADSRDLRILATQITAPTYLTGAFQDEQTGAQFSGLMSKFEKAKVFKGAMWNGRHPDGYAPNNLVRWFEFLEFYVAKRVPEINPLVRAGLPAELASNFNQEDAEIEPDRFAEKFGDDYDAALAAYEAEDPIRVQFESGAAADEVGEPGGAFVRTFKEWPPETSEVTTFALGADGQMAPAEPTGEVEATFAMDPDAGDKGFYKEGGKTGLLDRVWEFDWTRFPDGKFASFETAPLTENMLLAGPAEADLNLVIEGATDADLQVTLTEVRPDGVEYLLQSGWLRIGHRKVVGEEDTLSPEHSYVEPDYQAVEPGEEFNARISIPGVGAPIRAGSKLRMVVSTPGRDRAEWTFDNPSFATGDEKAVSYTIRSSPSAPSNLRVTTITPGEIPSALPPCPSLRGQACRTGS